MGLDRSIDQYDEINRSIESISNQQINWGSMDELGFTDQLWFRSTDFSDRSTVQFKSMQIIQSQMIYEAFKDRKR